MSVTASSVKALAMELASVADATIDTWIAIAERRVHRTAFGEKADDAVTFLTAHLVTVAQQAASGQSGSVGALTSRRVGDVSATFALSGPTSLGDSMLGATLWGQMYLDLREGVFVDRRV